MAEPAVSEVAAHGQSVAAMRHDRKRGSSPSSLSCDSVRAAPASGCSVPWNMLNMMNQMAAALPKLPKSGAKVGPSTMARSCPSGSGPSTPEPDHRQNDEIDAGHGGGGEHGTRHVAVRIDGLADVAGGCLEGRSGKPDQIETGHDRGEIAEPAFEGRGQMIVEGLQSSSRRRRSSERAPRRRRATPTPWRWGWRGERPI